jgi:O-antigen/teichoic acid export membrane protein
LLNRIKNLLIRSLGSHVQLTKDVIYIFLLRILELFLSFVAIYFVVRALSKESFGEYHFILSCVGLVSIFGFKGLNNSVMQAIARGYSGTFRKAVKVAFAGSLTGSFILFVLAYGYYLTEELTLTFGFTIAGILFPFVHGLLQWKSIYMGKEEFRDYFLHNSLMLLLMYFFIVTGVLIFPETLLVPLSVILVAPAIQNIWLTIINYRNISSDEKVERGNIKYGVKTTFYTSFYIISMHIDKLLLFLFLSPTVLASYVAADRIAALFTNITQDLSVVLAPKFARNDSFSNKLDRYLKIFVFIYGVIIVFFSYALLPTIITFLFGNNYIDSIPYAQALLCSVAIGNIAILKFRFIRSKIDSISFRNITVYTSIGRIVASISLIPWLGVWGAVISVFAYRILQTLIVNNVIKKKYQID